MSIQLYAQGHGYHAVHIVVDGAKSLKMSPSDLPGVRRIQAEQDARIRSMSSPHFNPNVPFYLKRKDSVKLFSVKPYLIKKHIGNNPKDSLNNKSHIISIKKSVK